MKKRILFSAIFAILVTAVVALSDFVPDVIVTSPNGIWTDTRAYNTIDAAITAIGTNDRDIYIVRQEATTALTIPSNISLHFFASGSIANSGQLTLNTRQIFAGDHQIFTGTGDIDFSSGSVIRSAWFSSAIEAFYRTTDDNITLVISKSAFITANRSIGNNVNLRWESPNNRLTANAGYTLSNIKNIEAGNFQLFAGAGDFAFLDGSRLKLDWFARLRSAINWIGSTKTVVVVSGSNAVDYNDSSPSNIVYDMNSEYGEFSISAGVTLTIYSPSNIVSNIRQIFTGTGTVVFGDSDNSGEVYPQWWGALADGITDDSAAVQAALNSSRYVYFPDGNYFFDTYTDRGAGTYPNIFINHSGQTLRGNPGKVVFSQDSSGNDPTRPILGIWIGDGVNIYTYETESGYLFNAAVRGQNTITTTVAANAGNFSAGDIVYVKGSALVQPGEYYGEMNEVVSAVSGTGVVTLKYALSWDYGGGTGTIADVGDETLQGINIEGIEFRPYQGSAIIAAQILDLNINKCKFDSLYNTQMFTFGQVRHAVFAENEIHTTTGPAIDPSRNCHDWRITDNLIYSQASGIGIGEASSHFIVKGNQIYVNDSTGSGIAISSGVAYDIVIDSNQVSFNTTNISTAAIYDANGGSTVDAVISNNIILTKSQCYAVKVESVGTVIRGNIIRSYYFAIYVLEENIIISANTFLFTGVDECEAIVLYDAGQSSIVTGNIIKSISGTNWHMAVFIPDSGPQSTGPIIDSNQITNCNYGVVINDIDDLPGTIIENNNFTSVTTPLTGVYETLVDSATPDVAGGKYFITGGTTTITNFTGGYTRQIINIIAAHTITITDGTNIFLSGSANYSMAAGDSLTLEQYTDGKWYEIGRGNN